MNWKTEAREKLRKYNMMKVSTITIPEEIKLLEIDARRIKSARFDGNPVKGGGNSREEAMLSNIIKRQELEYALQIAQLWVKSTDKALSALCEEERLILHMVFINPMPGAIERLCKELHCETSTVYRKRDKALHNFTIAFYGSIET